MIVAALLAFTWADLFEDDSEFKEFFNAFPSYPAGRVGRAQAYYTPKTQIDYKTPKDGKNYENDYVSNNNKNSIWNGFYF